MPEESLLDSPLLNKVQEIPPMSPEDFKNPAARHLAEHGLASKAANREACSKYCVMERCDGSFSPRGDKHTHAIYITCHQRYCKYCGPRRQRESLERWYAAHPYLRKRHNFLYFEISQDFDGIPTSEAVTCFNSDVLEFADIAEQGRVSGTGAIWNTVIRHIEGEKHRLVAKFIWWGDWDKNEDYQSCWWQNPELKVTMQVVPVCSFDAALRQAFDQEIPDDPIQSAHFELAVHDVRVAHCAGGFVRAKDDKPSPEHGLPDISEELFPTMECIGNNSTTPTVNTALTTPKARRACKTCGAPVVQRSEKTSVDATQAEIDALNWYDIDPSPPLDPELLALF